MVTRYIFKKRKSKKKLILFFLIVFFLLIIFVYFLDIRKQSIFIVIPENIENFYIIPKDRGGEKVKNLDKKSLNLNKQNILENKLEKPDNLLFSIQFYVDNNLENVNKYLNKITNLNETIYNLNDFYILAFTSDIGIEYFLLYKNFVNRTKAKNYCSNFLPKIDNCLIVDTTKF